jgi:hypothetical protein
VGLALTLVACAPAASQVAAPSPSGGATPASSAAPGAPPGPRTRGIPDFGAGSGANDGRAGAVSDPDGKGQPGDTAAKRDAAGSKSVKSKGFDPDSVSLDQTKP